MQTQLPVGLDDSWFQEAPTLGGLVPPAAPAAPVRARSAPGSPAALLDLFGHYATKRPDARWSVEDRALDPPGDGDTMADRISEQLVEVRGIQKDLGLRPATNVLDAVHDGVAPGRRRPEGLTPAERRQLAALLMTPRRFSADPTHIGNLRVLLMLVDVESQGSDGVGTQTWNREDGQDRTESRVQDATAGAKVTAGPAELSAQVHVANTRSQTESRKLAQGGSAQHNAEVVTARLRVEVLDEQTGIPVYATSGTPIRVVRAVHGPNGVPSPAVGP